MASKDDTTSGDNENLCVVCFKNVDIYSIGVCDHPVCFECSTRMRVLCCQNECPICRGLMPKVIFTNEIAPFFELFAKYEQSNLQDKKYGLLFASHDIQKVYQNLMEHRCNICKESKKFLHFYQLMDHMRREHGLFYCELCVENLKIFSHERKAYTPQELGYHRIKGDPDNTSHRGHPLCQFCNKRFMDLDELFRHLRRNHLFCHFCDADGKHQYYNTMEDLKKHFQDEHYLCEEGECKNLPLTAVFRTEIDLKAHIAIEHGKNLSKSATKQARTLEVEFTLAPRPRSDRNKRCIKNEKIDNKEEEEEGAVGYDLEVVGKNNHKNLFVNPLTSQDFPALGNSTIQSRPTTSVSFTSNRLNPFSGENFPSLGTSRSSAVTINSVSSRKKGPEVTITRTVKGQQALERNDENFPSLSSSSSNIPTSSGTSSSTVRLSVNNSTPKVSIHVNHNGAITTHITTNASTSNSEAFPALGSKVTIPAQPQWVSQKSKNPKPEQKSKVAPAPKLPPSDLSQFPSLKTNKKNNNLTTPLLSKNCQNNDGGNCANKTEPPTLIKDDNKKKKKKKISNNNTTISGVNNSALPLENNNNDMNCVTKKRSELKIGNLSLNNNQTKSDKQLPSSSSSSPPPPPPPGFPSKPPPGLNLNNFPTLGGSSQSGNDLTFTNSSGQSYAIIPSNNYHQPTNFSIRNQNLIKNLLTIITTDLIREFKNYSDLFRNGKISAESYYGHCKGVMGEKFEDFFPELLVLLPDINKQQELYKVYNGKNKNKLLICEKCKQIIYKNQLTEHYDYHTLDNHFPTLAKPDGFNVWKKK